MQEEFAKLGLPLRRSHSNAFHWHRLAKEEAEYALADRLACPSEFVAETFRQRGYPSQKLAAHQYGYDPAVFCPPESPARMPPRRTAGRLRGLR